ncbi:FAD-dependent monooxygenase [Dyadobacter frigoris]|uniref:FAD-binding monooxygenase n=1 Tax=Dyadobacter frigoris TaxID=2576211 RepID=A0A4U6CWH9_9BACT|nr:FAD-dependent monooxygenase [Dyadobacter frigoris]TKT87528.1 FAD-binding monooxygenase [Dyadobacter frigoris]GLU52213.1 oxidoreductase [Dyadobacter frigoris]
MESLKEKNVGRHTAARRTVLVSGASMAGLSTAWWMNKIGYKVTVVEIANEPRTAGGAVDIKGTAADAAKRMGIFEQIKSHRLHVEMIEFKNAEDITEGSISLINEGAELPDDDIEIERDKFVNILFYKLKNDIEFIFNNSITALNETKDDIQVTFKNGSEHAFDLVFGCDGIHSGVRKIWFGDESEYSHFLEAYSSITILNKLLIKQKTMQMYNVPDKAIMLNAYNNKTDIIFCFNSEKEIPYDYRDEEQQRKIILEQFAGQSWRTEELLAEIRNSENFYFDKFCQIKMPSWTKGRVALVGDAGYCASPAAGIGASLSIIGAAALADALEKHDRNFELAFQDYNKNLRPFIEEVQATAELNVKESFIPRTEEAIRKRNTDTVAF